LADKGTVLLSVQPTADKGTMADKGTVLLLVQPTADKGTVLLSVHR